VEESNVIVERWAEIIEERGGEGGGGNSTFPKAMTPRF